MVTLHRRSMHHTGHSCRTTQSHYYIREKRKKNQSWTVRSSNKKTMGATYSFPVTQGAPQIHTASTSLSSRVTTLCLPQWRSIDGAIEYRCVYKNRDSIRRRWYYRHECSVGQIDQLQQLVGFLAAPIVRPGPAKVSQTSLLQDFADVRWFQLRVEKQTRFLGTVWDTHWYCNSSLALLPFYDEHLRCLFYKLEVSIYRYHCTIVVSVSIFHRYNCNC